MYTDIDLVFEALQRDYAPPYTPGLADTSDRLPRFPLALVLEREMQRRARFLDSEACGPMERWPLASPAHLIDELAVFARRLKSLTGMRHTAALDRAARSAGYHSWEHAQEEKNAFEATSGEAFRHGMVIASTGSVITAPRFVADQGLLFLTATHLVGEYGAYDVEGGWYQLLTPSHIGRRRLEDIHLVTSRQLLLREVNASYWAPNHHVADFHRFTGETPATVEAALALAQASLVGGRLHYVWLRGEMHTVSPRWD